MTDQLLRDLLLEIFDYKDGKLLWKVAKGTRTDLLGKEAGNKREDGYVRVKVNNRLHMAHRLVFLMMNGYLPKEIDHIDGDRSNNKIENLRDVTKSENAQNRKMPINNTSGIKGVCWHKAVNKWYVQLQVNKKMKYFGIYDDLELAQLVAIEARDKYHGKYARNI